MMIRCELAYNDTVGLFYLRGGPNGMPVSAKMTAFKLNAGRRWNGKQHALTPAKSVYSAELLTDLMPITICTTMRQWKWALRSPHYSPTYLAVSDQITELVEHVWNAAAETLGDNRLCTRYQRKTIGEHQQQRHECSASAHDIIDIHLYICPYGREYRKWVINLFDLRCRLFCAIAGRFEWVYFSHMQRPIALCCCADGNHGARRMWQKQHTPMANNKQQKSIRISLLYSQFFLYFSAAFITMASTDKRAKIQMCVDTIGSSRIGQWAMLAT